MTEPASFGQSISDFARGWRIDLYSGLDKSNRLKPILIPLDNYGRRVIEVSQEDSVDYYLARIDYFDSRQRVAASRHIYMIMPGYHNQSAYLPIKSCTKIFEIHRGYGFLMQSCPPSQDQDDPFTTSIYQLNPAVTPAITVAPGNFYAFEAAQWLNEPLVISELITRRQLKRNWPAAIKIQPRQNELITESGRILVPADFASGDFN